MSSPPQTSSPSPSPDNHQAQAAIVRIQIQFFLQAVASGDRMAIRNTSNNAQAAKDRALNAKIEYQTSIARLPERRNDIFRAYMGGDEYYEMYLYNTLHTPFGRTEMYNPMTNGLLPWSCGGPLETTMTMKSFIDTSQRDCERAHNHKVAGIYHMYNLRLRTATDDVRAANSYLPIPSVTLGSLDAGLQPLTEEDMLAYTVEDWLVMAAAWLEIQRKTKVFAINDPLETVHVMRNAYQKFIGARAT